MGTTSSAIYLSDLPPSTRGQSRVMRFRSYYKSRAWSLLCTFATSFANPIMTYVSHDPDNTYFNDPAWWPFLVWTRAYSNAAGSWRATRTEHVNDILLTLTDCGFAVVASVVVVYDWGERNNTFRRDRSFTLYQSINIWTRGDLIMP